MEGAEGVGGVASTLDRPVFSVYPEGVKAIWQLQEAKARFSEVVERALKGEPQLVLRRGKKAVVVLDWETYARLTGEEASVLEALRPPKTLPNEEVEALFQRQKTGFREVDF